MHLRQSGGTTAAAEGYWLAARKPGSVGGEAKLHLRQSGGTTTATKLKSMNQLPHQVYKMLT